MTPPRVAAAVMVAVVALAPLYRRYCAEVEPDMRCAVVPEGPPLTSLFVRKGEPAVLEVTVGEDPELHSPIPPVARVPRVERTQRNRRTLFSAAERRAR